jgi:hypothetical protein
MKGVVLSESVIANAFESISDELSCAGLRYPGIPNRVIRGLASIRKARKELELYISREEKHLA